MKTLASLAAVLALAAAGTASAGEVRIAWGDLDLSTAAGADAFDARVRSAARRMCRHVRRPGSLISDRTACEAAIQDEAVSLLPGAAQVDYALSRAALAA
jgi:UrcA family protein